MPKNVSCNAFYMFMLDTKKRLEANGERFPRGMESVVDIAAADWERTPPERKALYKEKAKDYKKSDEFSAQKKQARARLPRKMRGDETSSRRVVSRPVEEEFVEPIQYVFPSDDDEAVEAFRKKQEKDRMEILDAWRWNMSERPDAIYDTHFFVISFISHCRTNSYSYFPAEIGVVEFTLRDGVINTFSKLLGPHALTDNLVPATRENYETHQIPFNESIEGMTDNYARVLDELLRFYRPSKDLRRLYCIPKEFNTVQSCVKFLQSQAKLVEIRPDRINCATDLFSMLCEWRDKVCTPAERLAFNDCDGLDPTAPFYRHPALLCEFHAARGIHRCALATAKRTVYYLLQRVQTHYRFELTDKHKLPPMLVDSAANSQAMANANWQLARAVQQAQRFAARDEVDDTVSMVSGTTIATRRTVTTGGPKISDVGLPRTLPPHLRHLADAGDLLENMDDNERNVDADTRRRDNPSRSGLAPSVTSGIRSGRETPGNGPGRAVNITWDQNKDVRDFVYSSHNIQLSKNKGEADQACCSQEMNQGNAIASVGQPEASMGLAAGSGTIRQRFPMSSVNAQASRASAVSGGVVSSTAAEFAALRVAPPPVAFPSPQIAQRFSTPLPSNANNFSGLRQRTSTMPPRVTLAQNPSSSRPEYQGTFVNAPISTNASTSQVGSSPSAIHPSSGPPVKTTSRVKQMLAERVRQQQMHAPKSG